MCSTHMACMLAWSSLYFGIMESFDQERSKKYLQDSVDSLKEHIRLGNGQKSQQTGATWYRSHLVPECICAFSVSSKNGHFWENMENIQKKPPAFKLSGPNSKRCSELWHPNTAFSCQTQKASKVTFEYFLSNMAQVDPRIPWDVLLQTNQKCKMYLFKIVYVLCKTDFFL